MAKTHPVGSEKYPADFSIIETSDLDVALTLATEGSKACNRKVEARRNAAKAAGGRLSCDGFDESDRSQSGIPESP